MDIDRRTAIAVGLAGASAASALLLGVKPSLAATETQGEEIAPSVHYLLLGEVQSPIEEFVKVSWEEITWGQAWPRDNEEPNDVRDHGR
jgi:hypothetical protein